MSPKDERVKRYNLQLLLEQRKIYFRYCTTYSCPILLVKIEYF